MSESQVDRDVEEARVRRADELGASSFPASDPPAVWTWDVAPAAEPAADAVATLPPAAAAPGSVGG